MSLFSGQLYFLGRQNLAISKKNYAACFFVIFFKNIMEVILFSGITSPKARGITKSNTMSNATGGVMRQQMDKQRKSAYEPSSGGSHRDHSGSTGSGSGGPGRSGSTDKPSLLDDSSHTG